MVHLFTAYQVESDREFVMYMKLNNLEHDEGRNKQSFEQNVALALNTHALMNKVNKWNMETPGNERVL